MLSAAPCIPVTRIGCARRTGRDGVRVVLRWDIADRAGIVDQDGAAVAIPSSSVAARSGP